MFKTICALLRKKPEPAIIPVFPASKKKITLKKATTKPVKKTVIVKKTVKKPITKKK